MRSKSVIDIRCDKWLNLINVKNKKKLINELSLVKKNIGYHWKNKRKYYDLAISFDIETSSFIYQGEPYACMYIWQMCIEDVIVYGRTWKEWLNFLDYLKSMFEVGKNAILVIYVHNLAYEFGFISYYFKWDKILALKSRRPIKATALDGIEFRCSYYLSGLSLEKVGENLKSGARKRIGNLDYSKIRHLNTPLTVKEMGYCTNDVIVLRDYIREIMKRFGSIANIPNTKTGIVRRLFQQSIYSTRPENIKNKLKYHDLMNNLIINGYKEFKQLKNAFSGGFTHCNPFYSQKVWDNISLKIDFTSSYPYVMCCENRFPMSSGTLVIEPTQEEFEELIQQYCCVFTIMFYDIETKFSNENYISASKCSKLKLKNFPLNNGRVIDAEFLVTTITEVDYEIIKMTYKWKYKKVVNLYYYIRGYLPKEFVSCLLDLYETKTILKGVEGKEEEYNVAKQNANSSYGMTVTNFIRKLIEFLSDKGWVTTELNEKDIEDKIKEYNDDKNRFLFYPWGIYITALARRNLWIGIMSVGKDYIYSDTDSLVIAKPWNHVEFIKKYNKLVYDKIEKSSKHFNIPLTKYMPKTIKGEEKPLGVWDIEDVCLRFKSIGAKRYLVEIPSKEHKKDYKRALDTILSNKPNWFYFDSFRISGKRTQVKLTVAGVSKEHGAIYLDRNGHDKAFEEFSNDLIIPSENSGKQILTYCDVEKEGTITDYLGIKGKFHEKSCIHMTNSEYSFCIDNEYVDLMFGIFKLDLSV